VCLIWQVLVLDHKPTDLDIRKMRFVAADFVPVNQVGRTCSPRLDAATSKLTRGNLM